ncbi:MAG: hypothetical protein ACK5VR_08350, partial [Burkholderiales bacterium]
VVCRAIERVGGCNIFVGLVHLNIKETLVLTRVSKHFCLKMPSGACVLTSSAASPLTIVILAQLRNCAGIH